MNGLLSSSDERRPPTSLHCFLADLFLELIEGVQRSSSLESKSLCLDGMGRSVTLHNRKTLQLILPLIKPSPGPCGNDTAVNIH